MRGSGEGGASLESVIGRIDATEPGTLAADTVPRAAKREVIHAALAEFRDTTRDVMTRDDWLMMGHHMGGIEAMGGPVLGLLRSPRDSTATPRRMPTMDHRP